MYRIALGKKQMVTEIIKLWIIISNLVIDIEKKCFRVLFLKEGVVFFQNPKIKSDLKTNSLNFGCFPNRLDHPTFRLDFAYSHITGKYVYRQIKNDSLL